MSLSSSRVSLVSLKRQKQTEERKPESKRQKRWDGEAAWIAEGVLVPSCFHLLFTPILRAAPITAHARPTARGCWDSGTPANSPWTPTRAPSEARCSASAGCICSLNSFQNHCMAQGCWAACASPREGRASVPPAGRQLRGAWPRPRLWKGRALSQAPNKGLRPWQDPTRVHGQHATDGSPQNTG